MKAGWEVRALGEVCVRITDGSHYSPETAAQGTPYVTVRDIDDATGKIDLVGCKLVSEKEFVDLARNDCRPLKGDVLFSKDGTVGKVALVDFDEDFVVLSSLAIVRPNPRIIDPRYLAYVLRSAEFLDKAVGMKTGVAIRRIILKHLKAISIPLPPLDDQKRIVEVLDAAFEGLTRARAHTEANLQNARELFESGLDAAFASGNADFELRTFGDKDLVEIIDGDRGANYPKKEDFLDEGHCLFLNTKNVRPDGFDFSECMFIDETKDKSLRNDKLKRRDVILTTRGTIGNIAVFDASVPFDQIRINSGMLVLRPNEVRISSEYLFEVLRSRFVKTQISEKTSGAAQPQLPIGTLVSITLPVPKTVASQVRIVKALQEVAEQTAELQSRYRAKLADLEDLRQSLLQKAFAGELT